MSKAAFAAPLVGCWLFLIAASPAYAQASDCTLPPVTPQTEIVVLGAYEANAISSVALGLQDNEARAGLITIQPGDRPLAIIIGTYRPTIWHFRGAVSRIAWVALSSMDTGPNSGERDNGPPLAGAVGLPAERVRFFADVDCIQDVHDSSPWNDFRQSASSGFITRALGRAPDVVSKAYAVSGFDVPSGTVLNAPFGTNTDGLAGPRTVVHIDPATVVASQPAKAFDVLPGNAGLSQLLQEGALVKMGDREYRVTRKIRFPAGLYGAQLAKFWIPKGVPVPDGDPGHSCVMSEATRKPLFGICK